MVDSVLKEIYDGLGDERTIEPKLFEASFKSLTNAIRVGWGNISYEKADFDFVRRLDNSAKWFAARKTSLQVLQLIALTKDEERGTKRPFREFKKLAEGVLSNYNKTWLKTEYETAVSAARSARDWQQYIDEADLYPNIEYLRTVSIIPREEHLVHVGIILPINHPFWDTHLPPIAFNCKCSVRNTDSPVTDIPEDIDTSDPVAPELQINSGKTGLLFNLPASTYYKETEFIPDSDIERELRTRVLPEMKFYVKAYEFPTGGSLEIHPGIDEKEWEANIRYGSLLAKDGSKVMLQPVTFIEGKKNVDAIIDSKLTEFKTPTTTKPDKMITNSVKEADEQGAEMVLIDISKQVTNKAELWKGLRGATIRNGEPYNKNIKTILLMYDKDTIVAVTREEIEDYRALNKLKK